MTAITDQPEIRFEFPPNDIREFNRMMELMERRLGMDAGQSTRWGMYHAARAASASTKIAPKQRPLRKNKGDNPDFPISEYPNYIQIWGQGMTEPLDYFITRTNAKERRIKRRGLAKNAWKWGLTWINMRAGNMTGYSRRDSVRVTDRHRDKLNPYIEMTSVLPYAGKALKGDTSTIMRRASNSMRKYMERRLKERIRERNL